jgi:raffinose/stachyose/melibiose transport system permease protein
MQPKKIWLFVVPALALHMFVILFPAISAFGMSLFDWYGVGKPRFVGIANYIAIFTKDDVFWRALLNNLKWTAFFLTIPILLGIVSAFLVLDLRSTRMKKLYRIIFFIPVVIAPVVIGRLWGWIYDPYSGVIAEILRLLGLGRLTGLSLIGNPDTALLFVAFVDNWHWWGFVMVVFYGACLAIDPCYFEVARIEGVSKWKQIIYVTIPLIAPTFAFIILLTIIWSFLAFEYVWIMTQGGPGHASELLSTWIYKKAFLLWQAGYASALAVILLIFSSVFIVIFLLLRQKKVEI